jgi:UDP-2,3-diacylglucosamine pyrophosphatase LpxH
MLVIISDLHLTDGTSGETIRTGAFRVFEQRLRDMAYDASRRANGKYKPIKEIHLVLLGDILDVIRSTRWLDGDTPRPWDNDPRNPALVGRIQTITDAILSHNKNSLAILKGLKGGGTITLPPATPKGAVRKVGWEPGARGRVPVKINMYYMVGNHDWFFCAPGVGYDQIRRRIVDAMGLDNTPTEPFPHNLDEVPKLRTICEQHNVYARHGDIFDPFNYEKSRAASSLGDAIVIELLNRFPLEVRKQMARGLPKACLEGLKEIDNVRPLLAIPVWVNGLLRRTCKDEAQIKGVKKIWDNLVDQFLDLEFVRKHDSWVRPLDLVDRLELALKFSQAVSFHKASNLLSWINETFGGKDEPFYRHAISEAAFKSQRARYIVYGHTHHPEIVPLDISFAGSRAIGQMHLNSGTWRRVHELAQRNPKEEEFLGYYVMTYLAFYQGDERGGRPFESWSGSLAGPGTQV